MTGERKQDNPSVYAAPGAALRSDMPDGYTPESPTATPLAHYPMLRAMRWIMRFAAVLYLLLGLVQTAALLGVFDDSDGGRADERAVTYPGGSQQRPPEVPLRFTVSIAFSAFQNVIYSLALLALAEAIKLGLDVREQQLRTAPSAPA